MKPSGILNFENVPDDAGDPDVKIYVNGEEVSAGGGSSDFTTATMTINTGSGVKGLLMPIIYDEEPAGIIETFPTTGSELEDGEYTIMLYKGFLGVEQHQGSSITVSGSAEAQDNMLLITGDFEITAFSFGS